MDRLLINSLMTHNIYFIDKIHKSLVLHCNRDSQLILGHIY